MARIFSAAVAVFAASSVLTGCGSSQEATEAPSAASPEVSAAPTEPITIEPVDDAEWQSIYDMDDFNEIQGSAGLVYSPQEAIVLLNGHHECGQTVDGISIVRDVITLEASPNAPQAQSRGDNASLAAFPAQVPDERSCGSEPIEPSFYKLTVKDPLFIPGQSYPVTLRADGENNMSQLIWQDPKE